MFGGLCLQRAAFVASHLRGLFTQFLLLEAIERLHLHPVAGIRGNLWLHEGLGFFMSCCHAVRFLLNMCLSFHVVRVSLISTHVGQRLGWHYNLTFIISFLILSTLHACTCLLLSGQCLPVGPDSGIH